MSEIQTPPESKNPVDEAKARVDALQAELTTHERELKMLKGRIENLNPKKAADLQVENKDLKERLAKIEKAIFVLMEDQRLPRTPEDEDTRNHALTQGVMEFCTKEAINPDIWKNIVS